jgi:hypothetical protein
MPCVMQASMWRKQTSKIGRHDGGSVTCCYNVRGCLGTPPSRDEPPVTMVRQQPLNIELEDIGGGRP